MHRWIAKVKRSTYCGRSLVLFAALGLLGAAAPASVFAADFTPGAYYWYAPEHEIYGRTDFYQRPSFNSRTVRIPRTERFRYGPSRRGWVQLEFDIAGKAYIHSRILNNMLQNPRADDALHEFKRASVFAEEPKKIEARLKSPFAPAPAAAESKLPIYKRYKESWGLKGGSSAPSLSTSDTESDTGQPSTRPLPGTSYGKPRSKYPLLPPILSGGQSEPNPEGPGSNQDEGSKP
jgi:hypothetical protein